MGPLPDIGGAIAALLVLAIVGVLALIGSFGWIVWWLLTHVTIGVAA